MAKLTGTRHGDAANDLFAFYQDKVHELEESGQYSMAAVALGLAVETAVLTYLLVEFGEENGGELEIPDSYNMSNLIQKANEFDVLKRSHQCSISHPRGWRTAKARRERGC